MPEKYGLMEYFIIHFTYIKYEYICKSLNLLIMGRIFER
jgi:hypothetical protein